MHTHTHAHVHTHTYVHTYQDLRSGFDGGPENDKGFWGFVFVIHNSPDCCKVLVFMERNCVGVLLKNRPIEKVVVLAGETGPIVKWDIPPMAKVLVLVGETSPIVKWDSF